MIQDAPSFITDADAGQGFAASSPPAEIPWSRVEHEGSPLPDYRARGPLFDHQRRVLEVSWDKPAWGWLLEMGTGKTRIAIDNLALLSLHRGLRRAIVLAPKTLVSNWVDREIPEHLSPDVQCSVIAWSNRKGVHQAMAAPPISGRLEVLVMNVEALSASKEARARAHAWLAKAGGPTALVLDESTKCKSPSAARTKQVLKLAAMTTYRRILTGSPVTRNPLDLFAQFQILDPRILGFSSYWLFRSRYAVMRPQVFGGRTVQQVVGFQNLSELSTKISKFSSRILKSECLDLPEKTWLRRAVEMTEEQQKIYTDMKKKAMTVLEDGSHVTATEVITQILRLHQVACGHVKDEEGVTHSIRHNRTEALLEVLEETQGKVVVWSNYVHCLQEIELALSETYGSRSVVTVHGGVSPEERREAVTRFQTDPECRFFVSNPAVGGYGLTLTAASTTVFYSNSWDLELRAQAEDRIHRIGQHHPCTYIDIVCEGSVDERIITALRKKIDLAATVMRDGPRDWLT